jgi:hypothetical protein
MQLVYRTFHLRTLEAFNNIESLMTIYMVFSQQLGDSGSHYYIGDVVLQRGLLADYDVHELGKETVFFLR